MKKTKATLVAECYKSTKGKWNFRLLLTDNLGKRFISASNQGFENKGDCFDVASGFTYKGLKAQAIEIKYYRLF